MPHSVTVAHNTLDVRVQVRILMGQQNLLFMSYNLFLDDYRHPKDCFEYTHQSIYLIEDWIVVRNYDCFVKHIESHGLPEIISFDHDLASEHYNPDLHGSETYNELYDSFEEKTGYDCAKWLIDYCIDNNIELSCLIYIHSMNPYGSQNIKSLFDTYYKYHKRL